MSTEIERPPLAELRHGLSALRGNWLWFVLLVPCAVLWQLKAR